MEPSNRVAKQEMSPKSGYIGGMVETNKTWATEDCDPVADIKNAMEMIKNTNYVPVRCFYCKEMLPDHLEDCRIAKALKKHSKNC